VDKESNAQNSYQNQNDDKPFKMVTDEIFNFFHFYSPSNQPFLFFWRLYVSLRIKPVLSIMENRKKTIFFHG